MSLSRWSSGGADPAMALVPAAMLGAAGMQDVGPGSVGRFLGAAMFLDISGFTGLSERLGRLGSAGTEELVKILNGFFGPAVDEVQGTGGQVVAFGGDAITAVWASEGSSPASVCAERLARTFRNEGRVRTSIGDSRVAARVGVASGIVDVAVGGRPDRLVILAHGAAIDHAVEREHRAPENTVESGEVGAATIVDVAVAVEAAARTPIAPFDPSRFAHPVIVERVRRGDTTLIDGHRRVSTIFARLPATPGDDPLLTDAMRTIVEVVDELGGEVIQITGGDKGTVALATMGAPTSSPDDACRAVGAGKRLSSELRGCSIGISTGTVFAGLIGGSGRSVYTVIGDTVNLAARLMQWTEAGEVLVDDETATGAGANFTFTDRRAIHVKGKEGDVHVHRLLDQRRRLWPSNRMAADGPLLGRSEELARAERAIEPRADRVRRVVIRGEAGIGKSRLARAVAESAVARGWLVASGGFAGFGDVTPYAGWHAVLRSILAADGEMPAAFDDLLPDAAGLAPLLSPMLGLDVPATARAAAVEEELRSELGDELAVRAIEAAARRQPIMISLEDWHWADGPSVRLLESLTRHPSSTPITVVITQRPPPESPPIPPHRDDLVLDLVGLPDDVTRGVAASALARLGGRVDERRLDRVVELGAGNPLMIETLVEMGDREVATRDLGSLLQARLDRLPDAELRPLLWASAFARPVRTDELHAAMARGGEGAGDLEQGLERLVRDGLLTGSQGDGAPLDFRHASVRQAAYERLSHRSRSKVHHSVAVVLEERGGQAVEIGQHLVHTDDQLRQRRWFPRAAVQARAAWAVDDAISWFDRALEVGAATDDVRLGLAEMLMVRGDPDRVARLTVEPCEDPADDGRRLRLAGERAMTTGATEAAVDVLAEALRATSAHGTSSEISAAGELLSRALLEAGRFDEAEEVARASVEGVDPADHDSLARAIGAVGTVQVARYELADAVATLRRAVAEAEQGEDRVRSVHLRSDLAAACAMSGDVVAALDAMLAARTVADEIGYRRHLALSESNEAQLRLELGDAAAALTLALRGLYAAAELGDIGLVCDNLLRLSANDAISIDDRRAILEAAMPLEASLRRPHTMIEFRAVSVETVLSRGGDVAGSDPERVAADAVELDRPDVALRVLNAMGERADTDRLLALAAAMDEPGDLFLCDVAIRRATGDQSGDDSLRARGLALYRMAPFATYRAALRELGVERPPTDVIVPLREPASDDPSFALAAVLDVIVRSGGDAA